MTAKIAETAKKAGSAEPPAVLTSEELSGLQGGAHISTVEIEPLNLALRRRAYQHNQTDLEFL